AAAGFSHAINVPSSSCARWTSSRVACDLLTPVRLLASTCNLADPLSDAASDPFENEGALLAMVKSSPSLMNSGNLDLRLAVCNRRMTAYTLQSPLPVRHCCNLHPAKNASSDSNKQEVKKDSRDCFEAVDGF
uniref:Uncharacterized protein n=1 Tax=Triticum urartu TaxID=4572 RepID=A0A8R7U6T7_TRIUA